MKIDLEHYPVLKKLVEIYENKSEAPLESLIAHFIVYWAAYLNRSSQGPFAFCGTDKIPLMLFLVVYGPSQVGRKGTAKGNILYLFQHFDKNWCDEQSFPAPASPEGVLTIFKKLPNLLLVITEFGGFLNKASQSWSNMSSFIRDAWDLAPLGDIIKGQTERVVAYSLNMIGHITLQELQRTLKKVDIENGFVNRIMWIHSTKRKTVRFPPKPTKEELDCIKAMMLSKAEKYKTQVELIFTNESLDFLESIRIHQDEIISNNIQQSFLSRKINHIHRIALAGATLRGSKVIELHDVKLGSQIFECVEEGVALLSQELFPNSNEKTVLRQEKVISFIEEASREVTLTEIYNLFSRNLSKADIEFLLGSLQANKIIQKHVRDGEGRKDVTTYSLITLKSDGSGVSE